MLLLPLGGVLATGGDVTPYLEFPPLTRYVSHAGFSWPVFIFLALFVLLCTMPLAVRVVSYRGVSSSTTDHGFPGWGWGALLLCLVSWFMAWTRFDWFADFQIYTFTPLWLGYIGIVNALTYKRSGRCMLTHRPLQLVLLFIVSAVFWWFFEYLNRFVQNWYYINIEDLSAARYAFFATLSFSTVLPAVLGTTELLGTFPRFTGGLQDFARVEFIQSKRLALAVVSIGSAGLFSISIYPDYLYPLLWLAPLFIITGLQHLCGRTTLFTPLLRGNWERLFLLAAATLVCGFFWELWNYLSYAKWIYSVPFVQKFHVFEMPLLGYAGYIPFGLECGIVADYCIRRTAGE